ncbi:MAG: hypothetical protein NUV60_02800 [Patescibacteria group bacterium]|nr:hypothetical protein [Patescibacteria group bacterium]
MSPAKKPRPNGPDIDRRRALISLAVGLLTVSSKTFAATSSPLQRAITDSPPTTLSKVLLQQDDWKIFNLLWTDPGQISQACDAMGWQTTEEVIAWVARVNTAVGNTQTFVSLIDPPTRVDYDLLPSIEWARIHEAIVAQCNIRDDFFVERSDAVYRLPTKAQLDYLAQACPIRRRTWAQERMDCDDYARAFIGWLASNGIGNIVNGFAATTAYRQGELQGGHAVVLVMDDTRALWALDAQQGRLYAPKSREAAKLGRYILADEMRVARAYF